MVKVNYVGSKVPLRRIEPLDLGQKWGLYYEGRVGERYRVRLSRHLPGGLSSATSRTSSTSCGPGAG